MGTIGAGRIGYRVLQRLVPFDCKELLYFDYAPLPEHAAKGLKCRRVDSLEEMLAQVSFMYRLRVAATTRLTWLWVLFSVRRCDGQLPLARQDARAHQL